MAWTTSTILALVFGIFGGVGVSPSLTVSYTKYVFNLDKI